MRDSYTGLYVGLAFAMLLAYLLMVVNFGYVQDPTGADDGAGHDHWNGANGDGSRRWWRAKRSLRPRRDWRVDLRYCGDIILCSHGLYAGEQNETGWNAGRFS
jgi:hypothetical protein